MNEFNIWDSPDESKLKDFAPKEEKIKYGPWSKEQKISAADIKNKTGWIANETQSQEDYGAAKVGFGKFKDLTLRELREEQPNYFNWANDNVPRFAAMVRKVIKW